MAHWTDDPANLVEAMEKLAFEAHSLVLFSSLCRCGVILRKRMVRKDDYPRSLFDCAFEYTFYVHLRSLLDFLHLPPVKDDVSCKHFGQAVVPYRDTNLKTELNKRLAHITAHRFTKQPASLAGDGVEYYVEHAEQVYKKVKEFVESLNSEQLKMAYRERFAELDAGVRKIGLALPPHFILPSVF
jgi:hypothetical protein